MGILDAITEKKEEAPPEPVISNEPRKVGETDTHDIYVRMEEGKQKSYYVPKRNPAPSEPITEPPEPLPVKEEEKWYNPKGQEEPTGVEQEEQIPQEIEQDSTPPTAGGRPLVRGALGKICICGECGAVNVLGE